MKKTLLSIAVAFGLATGAANAEGASGHIENIPFSFDGPFGSFDQNQLQRGLQVYTEVCAACHGLRQVAFRTLADKGGPHYSADQVKAYAAENFEVFDADLDEDRAARPSDKFPGSNIENAPDLSLMAKARAGFHGPAGLGINQVLYGMGGPEYIVAILNGYTGETKTQAGVTLYENTIFPGGWIAMAPPMEDGRVEYADGHSNDVHHMSEDVAAFLMWTAEPKLMARKWLGFVSVFMLGLMSILLYLTNKKLWAPIKRKD
ncbi:MAG: cytochrome c1 [Amylibacter sp.]|jgi:ubiquinol-cytochrome c reductase cytochrome c1 subunit|nr:cytochrome c1 [Amylibacter sp.]